MRHCVLRLAQLALTVTFALATGCGDNTTQPGPTGSVVITTVTDGSDPDPDGYVVTIESSITAQLPTAGTNTVAGVPAGARTLRLDGIASNCTLQGDNPRTIAVEADQDVQITLNLSCMPLPGTIHVTTITTGEELDPDGYLIFIDGSSAPIADNATAAFDGPATGDHNLRLSDLAVNCDGDTLQTVTVPPGGGTAEVTFHVTCLGPQPFDIAYAGFDQSSLDIYRINANGLGLTQLTHDGMSRYPAWSPDGTTIAFERVKALGPPDIYVMNPDGTNAHLLIADAAEPAWSPDGTHIAFTRLTTINTSVVTVMIAESDGSNPISVMSVAGLSAQPAWSPDGTTLAVTPLGPNIRPLQLVAAQAGAQPVTLVGEGNPSSPSWLPDGSRVAFTWTPPGESDSDIYLIAPDGSGLAPFSASQVSEYDPSWSPDGSALAMMVYTGTFQLYVVNREGTQTRRLTNDALLKSRPTWGPAQ